MNFYNELDPGACNWIQNLMNAKLIPKGYLDRRSIKEVDVTERTTVQKYTQAHFFAGIAGWPLALQLAGWPEEEKIWSASAPCPPFSSAGKKKACPECSGGVLIPCPVRSGHFVCCICQHAWFADERHLWPDFRRLVALHRPSAIIGEQVASKDGLVWFAGIRAGLEALGYAVGGTSMCAPATGAPHIRQRIFWVAVAQPVGQGEGRSSQQEETRRGGDGPANNSTNSSMAHRDRFRLCGRKEPNEKEPAESQVSRRTDAGRRAGGMGNSFMPGLSFQSRHGQIAGGSQPNRPASTPSAWSDFYVVECENSKRRRIGTGVGPLDYGIPAKMEHLLPRLQKLSEDPGRTIKIARKNRIAQIKGYGNSIVPQLGALFVRACMDILF